jgi:hypothetical protein
MQNQYLSSPPFALVLKSCSSSFSPKQVSCELGEFEDDNDDESETGFSGGRETLTRRLRLRRSFALPFLVGPFLATDRPSFVIFPAAGNL